MAVDTQQRVDTVMFGCPRYLDLVIAEKKKKKKKSLRREAFQPCQGMIE